MVNKIHLWAASQECQLLSRVGRLMAEFADFAGAGGKEIRSWSIRCKGGLWEFVGHQVVVELCSIIGYELRELEHRSIGGSHDDVLLTAVARGSSL